MHKENWQPQDYIYVNAVRALLGNVTPNLRMMTVEWNSQRILLRAYFDGEVLDSDQEDMEQVCSELDCDFLDIYTTDIEVIRYDTPQPLNSLPGIPIYRRKE